jgi:hypothetical protein
MFSRTWPALPDLPTPVCFEFGDGHIHVSSSKFITCHGNSNLKSQNSKLKTQMAKLKPPNSKPKTQNSKLKTQNLKLKTQNAKLKT